MANHTHYYSADGGFDYETFRDHFMKQAEGKNEFMMLHKMTNMASLHKTANGGRGGLILINTRGDKGEHAQGSTVAKLEVLDPAEATRKRAAAEMEEETYKYAASDGEDQSSKKRQKRKTTSSTAHSRKKAKNAAGAKSKPQRAKDIFDK